jgi:hypothetical protein
MLASGRKSEEKRRERRIGEKGRAYLIRIGLLWKNQRKTMKTEKNTNLFQIILPILGGDRGELPGIRITFNFLCFDYMLALL